MRIVRLQPKPGALSCFLKNSIGVDTGRGTKTSQFQTFQLITKSTAGGIKK